MDVVLDGRGGDEVLVVLHACGDGGVAGAHDGHLAGVVVHGGNVGVAAHVVHLTVAVPRGHGAGADVAVAVGEAVVAGVAVLEALGHAHAGLGLDDGHHEGVNGLVDVVGVADDLIVDHVVAGVVAHGDVVTPREGVCGGERVLHHAAGLAVNAGHLTGSHECLGVDDGVVLHVLQRVIRIGQLEGLRGEQRVGLGLVDDGEHRVGRDVVVVVLGGHLEVDGDAVHGVLPLRDGGGPVALGCRGGSLERVVDGACLVSRLAVHAAHGADGAGLEQVLAGGVVGEGVGNGPDEFDVGLEDGGEHGVNP